MNWFEFNAVISILWLTGQEQTQTNILYILNNLMEIK